jgi:hypothetical protein
MGYHDDLSRGALVRRFQYWYGSRWPHLALMIGCLAITWYAGARLLRPDAGAVVKWFLGAAIAHDLLLLPAYAGFDWALRQLSARLPGPTPWINYARVPFFLSGLLILIWYPLIARRSPIFEATTGLPIDTFFARWLFLSLALCALSAVAYGSRVALIRSRAGS